MFCEHNNHQFCRVFLLFKQSKHLQELILYIQTKGNLLHIYNMLCNLYFQQNAIYSIILSFYVQTIIMLFINHVPKFTYQHSHLKVMLEKLSSMSVIKVQWSLVHICCNVNCNIFITQIRFQGTVSGSLTIPLFLFCISVVYVQ